MPINKILLHSGSQVSASQDVHSNEAPNSAFPSPGAREAKAKGSEPLPGAAESQPPVPPPAPHVQEAVSMQPPEIRPTPPGSPRPGDRGKDRADRRRRPTVLYTPKRCDSPAAKGSSLPLRRTTRPAG